MISHEDCFVQDQFLDSCAKSILFGVFDGHGGAKVSEYLNKQFPTVQLISLRSTTTGSIRRPRKMLKPPLKVPTRSYSPLFSQLDQKIKNELPESNEMGSTATVGLILLEEAQRVLYVSHVGDSTAYLFDDKGGDKLTPDHRADNLSENERIK